MFYINIDSNQIKKNYTLVGIFIYSTTDLYLNWKYVEVLCDSSEISKVYIIIC